MNMSATDILEIYRKNDATIANKKQFLLVLLCFWIWDELWIMCFLDMSPDIQNQLLLQGCRKYAN